MVAGSSSSGVPAYVLHLTHCCFFEQAQRCPQQPAVYEQEQQTTYGELAKKVRQLRHYLSGRGLKAKQPVLIVMDRSLDFISALLATLLGGQYYVPIHPGTPAKRFQKILVDCKARWVLTHSCHLGYLELGDPQNRLQRIALDQIQEYLDQIELSSSPLTLPTVLRDDLACIHYTSGSTGSPKGVCITQQAIFRLFHQQDYVRITSQDCVAHLAHVMFDAVVFEIWSALLHGATIELFTPNHLLDERQFVSLFKKRVTISFMTVSFFNHLIQFDLSLFKTIKAILFGGEINQPKLINKLVHYKKREQLKNLSIIHVYGPTECTTFAVFYKVEEECNPHWFSFPIGKPLRYTQAWVLDEGRRPLPPGSYGELYLSGLGLAQGYVEARLNSAVFIKNPFDQSEGYDRLYKTGDRVRWHEDGNLEIIDRVDQQVKLRGFRIELSEIEQVLCQYSGIELCKVVLLRGAADQKQLVAYYQSKQTLSTEALIAFLREQLPEYMVPKAFCALTAFPLTANGKIDLRALPSPQLNPMKRPALSVQELSPLESRLQQLWQTLLKIESIGLHEDYFALGGDSILAMQLVAQAAHQGIPMTAAQLFHHPTIASLAEEIQGKQMTVSSQEAVREETIPLLPIQRWFFAQSFQQPDQFVQYVRLDVQFTVSVECLQVALQTLWQHSPVLRATFYEKDGEWQQQVSANPPRPFELVVRAVGEEEALEEVIRQAIEAMQSVIRLAEGNVFHACVLCNSQRQPMKLLLLAHHLVIDGVSWRVVVEDLMVLMHHYERQQPLQLPASTSIAAWGRRLRGYAESLTWEDLTYWHALSSLHSLSPVALRSSQDHREKEARTQHRTLTIEDTCTVLQSLQSTPVSLQEVLLTALVQTLSQWLQTETVVLTLEGHGREALFEEMDVSRTIGWFTALFPMGFELPALTEDKEALLSLLKAVREKLQTLPDRGVPYSVAYYETAWRERLISPTSPAISFNFLGHFTRSTEQTVCFDEQGVVFCSHPENVRVHSLEVSVWVVDQRLQVSWRYPQTAWPQDQIMRWVTYFTETVGQVASLIRQQPRSCYVPSDFKSLSLTQEELDRMSQRVPEFQTLWPLSPLQKGLLIESLRSPHAGFYHSQVSWRMHGPLHRQAFEAAWNQLLATHAALRASFFWDVASQPIQAVAQQVTLSCEWVELTDSSASQAEQQWQCHQAQQRHRAFDWSAPPLMRVLVVKFNASQYGVIWTHHHILLDGWSVALLLQQLDADYRQYQENLALAPLKPSPSYQHYLERVTAAPSSVDQAFWRTYLAGCTVTDLPMRKPLSETGNSTVLTYEARLSPSLSQRVRTFAQQQRLTLNTVFQFACAFLVSRYTNTSDTLIGFTVAQRDLALPGISQQVGLLINTLPYRLKLHSERSVAEHLRQAQEDIRALTEHGRMALTALYRLVENAPDHWFDCLFVFENYPSFPAQFKQLELSESTHYPLVLTVHPHEEIMLRFHYHFSALTAQQVERFCHYYQQLLEHLIDQAPQPITALTPYKTVDRKRLLSQWQAPRLLESQGTIQASTFAQRFVVTCCRYAQKIALISTHSTLTYAALADKVARWVVVLQKEGVAAGTRVGVYLSQGEAVVTALLALIQLKAVFVPLDPAHPPQRSRFMIEDAELTVIITGSEGCQSLICSAEFKEPKPLAVTVLDLPRLSQEVSTVESLKTLSFGPIEVNPVLYILYTSGSTGKPKGVIVREQGVVNVVDAVISRLGASDRDRLLSLTSPGFDLFLFEILASLTRGMTLIVSDSGLARDASRWRQWIETHRPTLMQSTPSGFELLLYSGIEDLHGVQLLTAGEPLTAALAGRLIGAGARLWNLYGATEATIHSTMILISEEPTIPIDPPIDNTQLYLLDHWGHPTPEEGIGELSIAGVGLAEGYLNQPKLTRSRFVWRSLLPQDLAVRLYQTGDLAQQQGSRLVYKGRCDDQVKIQGIRVELDEIRVALNSHPAVAQSVVIWLSFPGIEQRRLVAFYVLNSPVPVSEAELRHFLSQRLPAVMVPHELVTLSEFPLTVSGKVNKAQIVQQYLSAPKQKPIAEPLLIGNSVEKQLLALFRSTLQDPHLQPEDHFFARGGYSLLALQVLAEIKRVFKVEITVSMFSQSPTVSQLAALIEHSVEEAAPQTLQSALVCLKSGSKEFPSLFLVHPIGGTVFWFVSLAQHMQYPGPIYGIQDPGLLSQRIPFSSLEALASAYLELAYCVTDEMVLLGGASFGANVAAEMASQIQATGRVVPYVALLDGWAFYPEVTRTRQFLQALMERQFADTKARFNLSAEELVAPYLDLHWYRAHLLANYRLKTFSFPLTLFKAEQTVEVLQSIESPKNHWDNYCQEVTMIHVPGDHETMFYPPAVNTLAQKLDASLSVYLERYRIGHGKKRKIITKSVLKEKQTN